MSQVYEHCDKAGCPFTSCMGTQLCMLPNVIKSNPQLVARHAMHIACSKPRKALEAIGIHPEAKVRQKEMTIEECFAHIPDRTPTALRLYAERTVFKERNYIFVTGTKNHQLAYCTYCNTESVTSGMVHNAEATCPNCGTKNTAKQDWRGRQMLVEKAYITYYLKSAIDPTVLVAIGAFAVRDYTGDFKSVETQIQDKTLYVFKPGKGAHMFTRYMNYWTGKFHDDVYQPQKRIACQWGRDNLRYINADYSRENIADAVEGTPFQYSTWESYFYGDMTDFFALYARYPSVEYLTKLGFSELVDTKMRGGPTYHTINWRGKSVLAVLKLTKQELTAIRAQKLDVDYMFLYSLHFIKTMYPWTTTSVAVQLAYGFAGQTQYLSELEPQWRELGISTKRMIKYLIEQRNLKRYSSELQVLFAWRDYIRDCKTLGYDLRRMRIALPADIHQAHQDTIAKIQVEKDKGLDVILQSLLPKLKRLQYSKNGLVIRPVQSIAELVEEGRALEHCVGRYGEWYAKGSSIILVVRKAEEIDIPFVTVEVRNNQVVQCMGFKNKPPEDRVKQFVKAFAAKKLKPKATRMKEVAI